MELNLKLLWMYMGVFGLLNQNTFLGYEDLGWKPKSLIYLGCASVVIGVGLGLGYNIILKTW